MTSADRQALEYLENGPDMPGTVISDETLCAHIVYMSLVERGLASRAQGNDGPIYSITPAGRDALRRGSLH